MEKREMINSPTESVLFADCAHGIYIPQHFAETINPKCTLHGLNEGDLDVLLAGPDHDSYNDTWADVLDNCEIVDTKGKTWRLYQDGDLWLIPADAEWSEDNV